VGGLIYSGRASYSLSYSYVTVWAYRRSCLQSVQENVDKKSREANIALIIL